MSKQRQKLNPVKNSIERFFRNKNVRVTHILDLIFLVERRIRSLIGGLETSLKVVWEAIAIALAESNGFTVLSEDIEMPSPFREEFDREASILQQLRERKQTWIPMTECITKLREVVHQVDRENLVYVEPPPGHGVDVYILKDGVEYAFDIKTNQPNVGSGKRFNAQLLRWYAYRLFH